MADKPKLAFGVFQGAFQQHQKVAYRDLRFAGFTDGVAHKIAMDFASDFGRMQSKSEDVKSKVSKANKQGEMKIALITKGSAQWSDSLLVVRGVQQIELLYKEGILLERTLPKLNPDLQNYLVSCQAWADKLIEEFEKQEEEEKKRNEPAPEPAPAT